MMHLESLQQANLKAAERESKDSGTPFVLWPQDTALWKAPLAKGRNVRLPFPSLGDSRPHGWRIIASLTWDTDPPDRQGFSRLLKWLEPNKGYAFIRNRTGQVLGKFERVRSTAVHPK